MKKSFITILISIFFLITLNAQQLEDDKYRPLLHFSPKSGWINDPNGLIFLDGEYHLFYQCNPNTIVWGPMHWGHAVSKDLIHWEYLPLALFPDTLGTIFSGSVVYDINNTSGLGTKENPPLVAIFTHDGGFVNRPDREKLQEQSLAYSLDKGRTWNKYKGNPVLHSMNSDFRDPKVMWHIQTSKWVMTLAAGNKIMFFNSPNLKDWTLTGSFSSSDLSLGTYECPDLFPMQVQVKDNQIKWVLLSSFTSGTPSGSCGTAYFIGDFDGKTFRSENPLPRWFDYGADNYAGVTFNNIPELDNRRLFIGWMNNWSYANHIPATNWRGNMTLPRELKLNYAEGKYNLHTSPVRELQNSYTNSETCALKDFGKSVTYQKLLMTGCFSVEIILNETTDSFNITLSNTNDEKVSLNYSDQKLTIGRKNSGKVKTSEFFERDQIMQVQSAKPLKIQFVYDVSTLEIFVNDGESSMSEKVFPEIPYSEIKISSNDKFSLDGKITITKLTK